MGWDGRERREPPAVSPLCSTDNIPVGTLLTVPSVQNTGPVPGEACIVAAPTKSWMKSAEIWIAMILPALDAISEPLLDYLKLNGKAHHLVVVALSAYIVYRRKTSNYVIR